MRNDFIYPYHLNAKIKDNVTTFYEPNKKSASIG